MSNTRPALSPPSYNSVRSNHISSSEATTSLNLLGLNQHTNVEGGQKSPALSISEARDGLNEIKGWPEQPCKLRDRSVLSVLLSIGDVLITLVPVAFIVLAALAAKLDGQPIERNELGRNVKRIAQLGPTMFPIIFAAVAGRSLKTLTRYYAERGMQLGVLELLLASQTVLGAIESQLLLRKFTVISMVEPSDLEGWRTVPPVSSPDNYTSLAGLPISGLINKASKIQNFDFEKSYMELDCSLLLNVSKNDGSWIDDLGLVWSASDGSSALHNKLSGTQTSFFLDTNTSLNVDRQFTLSYDQNSTTLSMESLQYPRNILYGSMYEVPNSTDPRGVFALALRNCTVQQRYIEARVRCTNDGCAVIALRPSTRFANRNPYLTRLEDPAIAFNLMQNMPLATGSFRVGDSAPTELYIRGSEMPFGRASSDQPQILDITTDMFQSKFQLLLNTYYQLSMAPLAYTATLPSPSDDTWNLLAVFDSSGGADKKLPFVPLRANTTIMTMDEVYHCNYIWFALLLSSSVILIMLGAVGSAISHLCRAPDMMGYVSSFTYNSPYMQIPAGGASLGAMERARLLRDLRVKIGDARPDDEIGHIVFCNS